MDSLLVLVLFQIASTLCYSYHSIEGLNYDTDLTNIAEHLAPRESIEDDLTKNRVLKVVPFKENKKWKKKLVPVPPEIHEYNDIPIAIVVASKKDKKKDENKKYKYTFDKSYNDEADNRKHDTNEDSAEAEYYDFQINLPDSNKNKEKSHEHNSTDVNNSHDKHTSKPLKSIDNNKYSQNINDYLNKNKIDVKVNNHNSNYTEQSRERQSMKSPKSTNNTKNLQNVPDYMNSEEDLKMYEVGGKSENITYSSHDINNTSSADILNKNNSTKNGITDKLTNKSKQQSVPDKKYEEHERKKGVQDDKNAVFNKINRTEPIIDLDDIVVEIQRELECENDVKTDILKSAHKTDALPKTYNLSFIFNK